MRSGTILFRWGRGVLAVALAYFIISLLLTHTGRVASRVPGIGIALISLACILVGIWKGRTLESVGWVALLLFIFASLMS